MRFGVLGPLEVDGRPFRASGKQRALLVRLLLARGAAVPPDRLVDALWPESPPASAEHALQVYVSALRKAGLEIALESEGYSVILDHLDTLELERLLEAARVARDAGRNEEAVASWEAALSLWRGGTLEGFEDEPFAAAEIGRLEELRLATLEDHAQCSLALGSTPDLAALETLVAEHPLRERLQRALMLALYRSGRQAEALAVYRDARAALAELGLEPAADLRALQAKILRHDRSLDVEPESLRLRRHLPSPTASLVGRRAEIDVVVELLGGDARLVTLTGLGGIGKTRLGLAVAHEVADAFADGVWFVGLGPLADHAFVEPAVAEALELRAVSLGGYLAGRELLLLLDNFEHVLEAAPLVSELLAAAPRLKVLATSRSRLDLYGELEYPVPPLRLDEATTLFLERARAAHHEFAAGAGVDELCRRFDRLPLALELVAARARELTLSELLGSAGLDLAAGGPRDLPERQRTLRAAIAWSEARLKPAECDLFATLGVFSGGFEPAAVEAVSPGASTLLPALVASSLVQRVDGGRRLRMLATVRDYARERLSGGGAAEARRNHLAYFGGLAAELAPKLLGAGDADAHATLVRERDNLRAALAFARDTGRHEALLGLVRDLSRFWYVHADVAEGADWAEAALAAENVPPLLRAQALKGAALIDWRRDALELAECRAEEARTTLEALAEDRELLGALSVLGATAYSRGDLGAAGARFEEGAALSRRLGELSYLSIALSNLAGIRYEERDWEAARAAYADALAVARELGSKELQGFATYGLGAVQLHTGDLRAARRNLTTGLTLFAELGFSQRMASCCIYLAATAHAEGEPTEAAGLLGASAGLRADWTNVERVELETAERTRAGVAAALGPERFAAVYDAAEEAPDTVVRRALEGEMSTLSE